MSGEHPHSDLSLLTHSHPSLESDLDTLAAHTHSEYSSVVHTHAGYALTAHSHPELEARLAALEGTASPPPTPWDVPGWRNVFADDMQGGPEWDWGAYVGGVQTPQGFKTADGRYVVNPPTWWDTSGQGQYSTDNIRRKGGEVLIRLRTQNGVPRVTAMKPLPAIADPATAGITGPLRYMFRLRADLTPGFKVVLIAWATQASGGGSGDVWTYGESDHPEGNLDGKPAAAFMHHRGAAQGDLSDQEYFPLGVSLQDQHDYVLELWPGQRWVAYVDGVKKGESTTRVPGGSPFRINLQCETTVSKTDPLPAAVAVGYVSVKAIGLWVPA